MVLLNIVVLIASAVAPVIPQLIASLPPSSRDIASVLVALVAVVYHKFSAPTLVAPPVPVPLLNPIPSPPPITIVKP